MSNKKRIKKLETKKYKSTSNWNRFVQIFNEYKMGYSFIYSGGRFSGRSWKKNIRNKPVQIRPIDGNESSGMEKIISPKFIDPILMKTE